MLPDYICKLSKHRYKVVKAVNIFISSANFGEWMLHDNNGELLAIGHTNHMTVYPGFEWDGSTVIGKLYEDAYTILASLLHDVLYNVYKAPIKNVKLPFNLFLADYWMYLMLLKLAGISRFILASIYLVGLCTVGVPWKLGINKGFVVQAIFDN